ncbi:2-amino-4-hydroxy-6-hydroxymethyldihydropteridine diphosphokinase [Thermocrinis minervae]|uniref:2-amino-4-hydroxy-6- hydroxymethyldihydropteridine diphosphokinase n=1 Tax=Thermocrinis minervae TaxID=381751 RepID=UPI0022B2568C|nr:2-amino-4-hydroxy-6-hydroxymethyldihydropteridine diphosphokinase [Thermocrinis minervae]
MAFGSNVGDRISYILKALNLLTEVGNIKKVSTLYESPPWGYEKQDPFINGVIEFETSLKPIDLLHFLKKVEKRTGRIERFRWGPREIDLDILLYEDYVIMLSFLRIPHMYLTERDFFLVPLLEINPDLVHPISKRPLKHYLEGLNINLRPYACIT